jgi:hypothetical protein
VKILQAAALLVTEGREGECACVMLRSVYYLFSWNYFKQERVGFIGYYRQTRPNKWDYLFKNYCIFYS